MAKTKRTESFLTDDDWEVLDRVCAEVGIPADIVERMLLEQNKVYGMGRRHNIFPVLDDLIAESLGRTRGSEDSQ